VSDAGARIVVVDDHPLVLDGLADVLHKSGYRVAKARNPAEARALLGAGERFDAALLDINLGQESGLELLDGTRGKLADRVILLSGLAEQEWILKGFEAGAIGFIPKSTEMEQVVEAVGALLRAKPLPAYGWVWSTPQRRLVEAREFFPAHTLLTPAEREVFLRMRDGKQDKQIADELGRSIHTVRVHIRSIKRKRGHNRRGERNF
jgi:DNA-binding NarL/FixJ family response regulator